MQSYSNLRVTGRAREVVRATYDFTRNFPRTEQFGLTSQMRRAALSSALNIVEGCSRNSTRELIRFLEVSSGSAMELEFTLLIAEDLDFGQPDANRRLFDLNHLFQKELASLIGALRRRAKTRTRS
jgi:four helix bundle protein